MVKQFYDLIPVFNRERYKSYSVALPYFAKALHPGYKAPVGTNDIRSILLRNSPASQIHNLVYYLIEFVLVYGLTAYSHYVHVMSPLFFRITRQPSAAVSVFPAKRVNMCTILCNYILYFFCSFFNIRIR